MIFTMTLSEYIKHKGDAEAARILGIKIRTAASWRRGERMPRPEQARRIVSLTGGEVSLADIYAERLAA